MILTNTRALARPLTIREATDAVSEWLGQPCAEIAVPGENHWDILQKILSAAQARGPLVTDAHLAALALEYGATLCTTDRDFARFRNVRVEYPLD